MENSKELYDIFKENLESVNGLCSHAVKADVPKLIADVFKEAGVKETCIFESELMKECKLVEGLEAEGITVYTDHIRIHGETAKGGISEVQYGIAELGTVVQTQQEANGRMVAIMSEYYIGIIKKSKIVATYDDMFDIICDMPEQPGFVGFITGPSRTADIECVGTVGVHGPIQVMMIVVDDE